MEKGKRTSIIVREWLGTPFPDCQYSRDEEDYAGRRTPMAGNYWLLKTDPETFTIDDLASAPKRTTGWDGVRNYQARNMLRDEFSVGDQCLIYHSGGDEPSVVGTGKVVRKAYPDPSAADPRSPYFDAGHAANRAEPRWFAVDVQFSAKFAQPVSLVELRSRPELAGMDLLRKGNRLSVQRVTEAEFRAIEKLGAGAAKSAAVDRSTKRADGTRSRRR